ncbi:hypothetical protein AVEN_251975-1 [Araneus ventricosus]|uniref:Uncharacterized protein n=1 Tax=Araneus ventricosus TaxID=182803 RepID=A0A4Y2HMH5_ARAVE|nr:hypothetical protein AVEN_251975-1 [Araneus ventricosus]
MRSDVQLLKIFSKFIRPHLNSRIWIWIRLSPKRKVLLVEKKEKEKSSCFRNKVSHIIDPINETHPVCLAFQETYLKPSDLSKIRRYVLIRKDTDSGQDSEGVVPPGFP